MSRPLPESELQEAVDLVGDWSPLRGARIFITGGTGFFGKWLLEVLGRANSSLNLHAEAVVLSRNPEAFLLAMPHLQNQPWLRFHQGEITAFAAPPGPFSHLIHGAASSDARDYTNDPLAMHRTMVEGTRQVLRQVANQGAFRALILSSGAVYGPQPADLINIPEDFPLPADAEPQTPAEIYALSKRLTERIATQHCDHHGHSCSIARCFAFAGPHLPLDRHFAFGNFIRDAIHGGSIRVNGDGTPMRSFLYASELAAWLWALAIRGSSTTYNVGSSETLSILDLAQAIGKEASIPVQVALDPAPGRAPSRYVPSIAKIRAELELTPKGTIDDAIRRSLTWHLGSGDSTHSHPMRRP